MGLFKPNVPKLAEKKDVPGLIKALAHKDPEIRAAAAKILGELRAETAAVSLVACLRDRELNVWREAADALVKIGKPAVEPLAGLIIEKSVHPLSFHSVKLALDEVQRVAIDTLRKIGNEKAVERLIFALKDSQDTVCEAIADALGKIGSEKTVKPLIVAFKESLPDCYEPFANALVKIGQPAVNGLVAALKDENSDFRRRAAETLDKIGLPADPSVHAWHAVAKQDWHGVDALEAQAADPLIAALEDKDPEVRKNVRRSLVKVGQAAVAPLVLALHHHSPAVRFSAVQLLEKIGLPDDPSVLAYCAVAKRDWKLAASMGAIAVEPLIVAMDGGGSVGWSAAEALAEIGDDRGLEWIIDGVSFGNKPLAQALLRLYGGGKITEHARQRILSVRDKIGWPHEDRGGLCETMHTDEPGFSL
jgi:HEAT repeat protein